MKNKFVFAFSALFLLAVFAVKSQSFTNYSTVDGLPDNFINGGVAIDTNNNKWFGTAAGVAKFDDATWEVFTIADGLPDNFINCIAVDGNNNVWAGTSAGVSMYDGNNWTTYTVSDGLADNGIYAIAGDTDGNVWLGTYGYGVTKYDGANWTTFNYLDGFPGDVSATAAINQISVDPFGNKWFATDMGLVSYDGSNFTTLNMLTAGDSLLSDYITCIAVDDNNHKWLGTLSYGIARFDNTNNWMQNYRVAEGLYNNYVQDIDFDSQGNMWIGMFASYNGDGGITKFDSANGVSYTVAQGLVDAHIIRMAIDKNDNVWIATGNGVSKFTDFSGICENDASNQIQIYPNPTNENIYINKALNSGMAEISDITGKKISSQPVFSNSILHTENLENGLYFLRITADGKTFNCKFIKE